MNVVNCSTRLPPKPAISAESYPVIIKPNDGGYHRPVEHGVGWNGKDWIYWDHSDDADGEIFNGGTVVAWVDPIAEVVIKPAIAPAPVEDLSSLTFTAAITDAGANRLGVIKLVREVLGLGLGESKAFIEVLPKTIKESLTRAEADALQARFTAIGAAVSITKE